MKLFSLISAALSGTLGTILYTRDDALMFLALAAAAFSLAIVLVPSTEKKAGLSGASSFGSNDSPSAASYPDPASSSAASPSILTSMQLSTVSALLREGKKVQAVKEVRQWTGMGLLDAKNYVDSLERGL